MRSAGSLTKRPAPRCRGGDWRGIGATDSAAPVDSHATRCPIDSTCARPASPSPASGDGRSSGLDLRPARTARAMPPERTAALLKARLAEQGVGLAALQVDTRQRRRSSSRARPAAASRSPTMRGSRSARSPRPSPACSSPTRSCGARFALADPVEAALPPGLKLRDAADAPIRWVDLAHAPLRACRACRANLAAAGTSRDPYADYDEALLLRFLRDFRPTRGARHALGVFEPRLRPARLCARPRRRQQLSRNC